jgi:hypothetical protein
MKLPGWYQIIDMNLYRRYLKLPTKNFLLSKTQTISLIILN